jgi:hypothetical protein
VVARRYRDYLGGTGDRVDLEDQIANSHFDDPEPRIWITPADQDEPAVGWNGLNGPGDYAG